MVMMMSPSRGVRIFKMGPFNADYWAVKHDRHVFLRELIQGYRPGPLQFWILVSGWTPGEPLMEAAVTANFVHGDRRVGGGEDFIDRKIGGGEDFIIRHPPWTTIVTWVADYHYYYL